MSSRFTNNPSADYLAAVEALAKVSEDEVACVYADATHLLLLEEFKASRKIKRRAPIGHHVCVHRLKGNRQCPGYARYPPHDWRCPQIPHGDHLSEWTTQGKTVAILSQPYGLVFEAVQETVQFCVQHGLEVLIDTYPSFHFPTAVLSLVFTRKGFYLGPNGIEKRT